MSIIRLEFGEEKEPTYCECCGNQIRSVYGFIYNDNNAYAVYFASWTIGHPEKRISIGIGIGDWNEESKPSQRRSFGLECRITKDQIQFTAIDADQSPWGKSNLIGKMLDREDALKDRAIDEIYHVADHIVSEDPRVATFIKEA